MYRLSTIHFSRLISQQQKGALNLAAWWRAIKNWDSDLKVAVIGSGGMSHFVIDEDLDQLFIKALSKRDDNTLTSLDEGYFQTGTSELKNWISAAGVLFDTTLNGDIIDYVPCYRSEAGTGTANVLSAGVKSL